MSKGGVNHNGCSSLIPLGQLSTWAGGARPGEASWLVGWRPRLFPRPFLSSLFCFGAPIAIWRWRLIGAFLSSPAPLLVWRSHLDRPGLAGRVFLTDRCCSAFYKPLPLCFVSRSTNTIRSWVVVFSSWVWLQGHLSTADATATSAVEPSFPLPLA